MISETLLILLVLMVSLLIKIPVAIAIGMSSLIYLFITGVDFRAAPQNMFITLNNATLIAIPLFLLTGYLMNSAGFTERIFDFARKLVGHIKGGLGHVNVVASIIFAGMSGSAVADAVGLGAIEIKAMTDAGYDRDFSAVVTLASSTIGPIIPPSIVMIIYGVASGTSIGALFLAGIIPGIIMGLCLMVLIYFISLKRNYPVEKRSSLKEVAVSFLRVILPALTPFIIVGGILMGIFTPTEAAVVAVLYTVFIGFIVFKEIKLKDLPDILLEVGVTTSAVLFVVSLSGLFGWVLARERIPFMLINGILGLSSNPYAILLMINVLVLILGCFLDATPIIIITVPLFMPLIREIGVHPVHFGIIICVNTMIGLITPPIGVCLYGVAAIAKISVERIIGSLLPFFLILVIALLIITFCPSLVLFIPRMFGLIY